MRLSLSSFVIHSCSLTIRYRYLAVASGTGKLLSLPIGDSQKKGIVMSFVPLYLAVFVLSLLFQVRDRLIHIKTASWHYRTTNHFFHLEEKGSRPRPVLYWMLVLLSILAQTGCLALLLAFWLVGFVLEGMIPRLPTQVAGFSSRENEVIFSGQSFAIHKAALAAAHVFIILFLAKNARHDIWGALWCTLALGTFLLVDVIYISSIRQRVKRLFTTQVECLNNNLS
jgi:hypothetical protein